MKIIEQLKEFHRHPDRVSYPVIAWRLLWMIPIFLVVTVLYALVCIAHGRKNAREIWDTVFW